MHAFPLSRSHGHRSQCLCSPQRNYVSHRAACWPQETWCRPRQYRWDHYPVPGQMHTNIVNTLWIRVHAFLTYFDVIDMNPKRSLENDCTTAAGRVSLLHVNVLLCLLLLWEKKGYKQLGVWLPVWKGSQCSWLPLSVRFLIVVVSNAIPPFSAMQLQRISLMQHV